MVLCMLSIGDSHVLHRASHTRLVGDTALMFVELSMILCARDVHAADKNTQDRHMVIAQHTQTGT